MSDFTDIVTLIQFTVETNEDCLVRLLQLLTERGVNIRAYMEILVDCRRIIKFIPNIPGEEQGLAALTITREVLRFLGLHYTEQAVISVGIPNLPGQLARISSLFLGKVQVRASYIDETLDQIYEVNNLNLAIQILLNASTQIPFEPQCCVFPVQPCCCVPVHPTNHCYQPRKEDKCCNKRKKHKKHKGC
uniref:ACT domain-containing protein n=1 Tax=viral metagenome TaxID=1070528 RepID=A0A6C0BN86_9ZZZZ